MDLARVRTNLARSAAALEQLVRDLTTEDSRWRAASGTWSLLEIVNHLADEEVEDFQARLERLLQDPALPWAPIDPEGWAKERAYQERELDESLARFLSERRRSLTWLGERVGLDPNATHDHPSLGTLRAGDLLASWQAHDLIHLRQVLRWHHDRTEREAAPFSSAYAGPW
jgi:hypothetical protein